MSHRPISACISTVAPLTFAVPASSMKMMQKAVGTDADAVFSILEDAVAAPEKEAARQLAITALQELDWRGSGKTISYDPGLIPSGQSRIWLRLSVRPRRILIPSSSRNSVVPKISMLLIPLSLSWPGQAVCAAGARRADRNPAGVSILRRLHVIITTWAVSVLKYRFGAEHAASVSARTVEIEQNPDYPGDQFHFCSLAIVAAARANGIVPMDSAYGDFNDPEGYIAAAKRAAIGMNGKWAIHPSQISLANDEFSPTSEEVSRARAILAAPVTPQKAAVRCVSKAR